MNKYLLNLARRGAGIGSRIPLRPPPTPSFPHELGLRHFSNLDNDMLLISGEGDELQTSERGEVTPPDAWDARIATPSVNLISDAEPAEGSSQHYPFQTPHTLETEPPKLAPPTGREEGGLVFIETTEIRPRTKLAKVAIETIQEKAPQSSVPTNPPIGDFRSESTSVSSPRPENEIEVANREVMSTGARDPSSPPLVVEKTRQTLAPHVQPPEAFVKRDLTANEATIVDKSTSTERTIEPCLGEQTAGNRTELAMQPVTSLKPRAKPSPSLALSSKHFDGRSEPRPVEIRIGTIEVRAKQTPSAAPRTTPAAQGFEDYLAIRTYSHRDLG